ncbi:conjugal transfer protein TraB [Enterobacteriaceae bacterium RIT714]|uniref:TraB/GumN family protein n=1 Tax=Lelliottia sp. CFBP8978 TaxID=3096522 RepID=UPI0012ACAEAD|nr:TraB/GumN family protein [Lelliottia sp. CFBP8978]MDY1036719.1 TraB/GumN family protein [Lelliottia sp. CFBP8978]MRS91258.1 conjugal transfer protein TraB [Enterobacteriaceae bacterium RIT714]
MSLFNRIKTTLRALFPRRYPWPGLDIALPGGQHLHLVGSIHMGTRDMSPLPPALINLLRTADALIVEADISGSESPFANLDIPPPLSERLNSTKLAELARIADEVGLSVSMLETQPLWQIAMVLQATQAQRLGLRGEYGIDYQLLNAARARNLPVIELEGAASQIALLRQLPDDGLPLLDDTLTHWHTNARLLQMMISWWLETPPANSRLELPSTFSESLYDVLMHERNQAWRNALHALPAGRYVVAVGALHLYGEGNLPSLLQ